MCSTPAQAHAGPVDDPVTMKHVLFVDDDPRVLDGLRDLLRPHRLQWRMSFASGGQAALAEMERNAADVVVCDLRMPWIAGAPLLELLRAWHPDAGRIVLSGRVGDVPSERLSRLAHVVLSKPCDGETLIAAINRVAGAPGH